MYAKTRHGELRIADGRYSFVLNDSQWTEIPNDLAESIRPHVNVELTDKAPPTPVQSAPTPTPPGDPPPVETPPRPLVPGIESAPPGYNPQRAEADRASKRGQRSDRGPVRAEPVEPTKLPEPPKTPFKP